MDVDPYYFDQIEEISTAEDDKIEEHDLVANLDKASTSGRLFEDPSEAFSDEYLSATCPTTHYIFSCQQLE